MKTDLIAFKLRKYAQMHYFTSAWKFSALYEIKDLHRKLRDDRKDEQLL